MVEEIRRAEASDDAPFNELNGLLRRCFEEWQPEGERALRIGAAAVGLAYRGEVARRYTEDYTRPYRSDEEAAISVQATTSDAFPMGRVRDTTLWEQEDRLYVGRWDFFIELDRSSARARAVVSHEAGFNAVDSAVRVAIASYARPEQCTLIHGMAMARGEAGIIGSAPGRGGKSTSARLLRAQGWRTLCDDLPAVYEDNETFTLAATPFWSYREADFTFANFTADRVPLRAVFLLLKGPEVKVEPCGRAQAAAALMRNVMHFGADPSAGVAKFEFISRLVEATPVFRLWFHKDRLPEEVILERIVT
ncbi:MAG: hypothetical protein GXP25_15485 [Planctomycetes bacterium]|nr:hypothetical protein [Planctomycetota bacterium]